MPNVGDVLNGKVVKILRDGAIVKLQTGGTGFLHISEISTAYIKNINDYLQVGKDVKVKVIDKKFIDKKLQKISLSIRKINSDEDKKVRFEGQLTRFLRDSGDKQKQIQKGIESKQGIKRKPLKQTKNKGN
jgi:predicted RNA-binding protein with RPS1 domain